MNLGFVFFCFDTCIDFLLHSDYLQITISRVNQVYFSQYDESRGEQGFVSLKNEAFLNKEKCNSRLNTFLEPFHGPQKDPGERGLLSFKLHQPHWNSFLNEQYYQHLLEDHILF